ncbi:MULTISPECIES: hypothetical protein [Olivibacter]|uniref:Uncharacterized protein n=1 Tax=Olivibacter oleidegradans TaxID=760123 RepID=A0ABV6HID9_9SPHI|nr:hypothetical protein [Olivibacter jilunii]
MDTIINSLRKGDNGPRFIKNQKSVLSGEFLFVCSNLNADNEDPKLYKQNIPIDIYNIHTGIYEGSFYIPLSENKLIKSFVYDGQILAALYYDNVLVRYDLNFDSVSFSHRQQEHLQAEALY